LTIVSGLTKFVGCGISAYGLGKREAAQDWNRNGSRGEDEAVFAQIGLAAISEAVLRRFFLWQQRRHSSRRLLSRFCLPKITITREYRMKCQMLMFSFRFRGLFKAFFNFLLQRQPEKIKNHRTKSDFSDKIKTNESKLRGLKQMKFVKRMSFGKTHPKNSAAKIFSFVLLCVFAVSTSAQTQKFAGQNNQFRAITVLTEPKAIVWLNDIKYGVTDDSGKLEIKTVPTGRHSLRVRADGFKQATQNLLPAQKGEIKIALTKTIDEAELAFQEAERMLALDREKAVENYRKAIKLRPKYPEAYLALARVLSDMRNMEEALVAVQQARKQRLSYAEASAVEGRIHKENGDEDKAIAAFKRAVTEGKGFQPEALTGLGLLYKEKAEGVGGADYAQEETLYMEAVRNLRSGIKQLSGAPDAEVLYQLLGLIYEKMKKFEEAIAVYEEFLRIFPDSNEAGAVRSFIVQIRKQMSEQ
jgi:cytochrome c-type biogenesis protein CcmH/NrfG